jgi:GNAT superfamily N-acetyltransferase
MINVIEVNSKRLMKKFVNFPLQLYKDNPYYVPLFFGDEYKLYFPKKNVNSDTTISKFFLAYKDGEIAGRIAALIVKPYIEKTGRKVLRFCRFDLIDDADVAKALFDKIEEYAREQGLNEIQGPMGYNDTDREGLLLEGFDKISTFAENYSFPYYVKHVENNGFKKETDWLEYMITIPQQLDEKVNKISELVAKRFKLKDIADSDMSVKQIINKYINQIFNVVNRAYESLHGTIPLKGKVVMDITNAFKLFLLKDFISVVVNEEDQVIGFGVALSSITEEIIRCRGKITPRSIYRLLKLKHNPKIVEFGLIAILPEYQKKGVNAIIMNKIHKGLIKRGITKAETNLELETNSAVLSLWEGADKELIKRRRCYIKQI